MEKILRIRKQLIGLKQMISILSYDYQAGRDLDEADNRAKLAISWIELSVTEGKGVYEDEQINLEAWKDKVKWNTISTSDRLDLMGSKFITLLNEIKPIVIELLEQRNLHSDVGYGMMKVREILVEIIFFLDYEMKYIKTNNL